MIIFLVYHKHGSSSQMKNNSVLKYLCRLSNVHRPKKSRNSVHPSQRIFHDFDPSPEWQGVVRQWRRNGAKWWPFIRPWPQRHWWRWWWYLFWRFWWLFIQVSEPSITTPIQHYAVIVLWSTVATNYEYFRRTSPLIIHSINLQGVSPKCTSSPTKPVPSGRVFTS